ncbi:MAG: sigma-70 family RNA polymerase sigma factor [Thermomicrobiales bacterium]|nr:sigma-70 family RNA polymerase sigma factor [Thermomicrobiales bacterium]MCO5225952.1 sigma-70 family RNA polymerase sigma factor [Thermomicrobiales bacterium]
MQRPNVSSPAKENLSDLDLIELVANQDEDALRELYERHARWLAYRLQRSLPRDTVEDVLQETFLAVWKSAGKYRETGDFKAWIWVVARNNSISWVRKHHRPGISLDEMYDSVASQRDIGDQVADMQLLQIAMNTARESGEINATIARRVIFEGHRQDDIAEELDMPVGTIKSRLHRIRAAMRAAIDTDKSNGKP